MSKPILFVDFFGTLCHDKFWRSLPINEHKKIQELLFANDKEMVNDWMRGKYTSEEVNTFLAKKLSLDYQKLWETFVHDCKTMLVPTDVLERIGQLRKNYKTILITGNMDCFSRFTVPALNLDQYFDFIINSYEERQLKDEGSGEQFLKIINQEQVNIQACVLIDDSMKVCKLFESLGGKIYPVSSDIDINSQLQSIEESTTLISV